MQTVILNKTFDNSLVDGSYINIYSNEQKYLLTLHEDNESNILFSLNEEEVLEFVRGLSELIKSLTEGYFNFKGLIVTKTEQNDTYYVFYYRSVNVALRECDAVELVQCVLG